MKLVSCDGCGVVLDADKVGVPEIRDEDGCVNQEVAHWDGETYLPTIPCPVCKTRTVLS